MKVKMKRKTMKEENGNNIYGYNEIMSNNLFSDNLKFTDQLSGSALRLSLGLNWNMELANLTLSYLQTNHDLAMANNILEGAF